MIKKIKIFLFAILFLLAGFYCSKSNEYGILGIEVPVGSGKITENTPYMVTGVYMDSPAYKAGIRPDDIIVQINDTRIEKGMNHDNIYHKFLLGKPGEKVTLVIKRKDKQMIFEIVRARKM